MCVPAVRECHELDSETAGRLVTALANGRYDVTVFMTGVAVSFLFEAAEQLGRRPELVAGLRQLTTVCRGPKPTAALRGFGVAPTLTARESFTSAEVIDAFAGVELSGRRVLLFHYGERSDSLAETLLARQAHRSTSTGCIAGAFPRTPRTSSASSRASSLARSTRSPSPAKSSSVIYSKLQRRWASNATSCARSTSEWSSPSSGPRATRSCVCTG